MSPLGDKADFSLFQICGNILNKPLSHKANFIPLVTFGVRRLTPPACPQPFIAEQSQVKLDSLIPYHAAMLCLDHLPTAVSSRPPHPTLPRVSLFHYKDQKNRPLFPGRKTQKPHLFIIFNHYAFVSFIASSAIVQRSMN